MPPSCPPHFLEKSRSKCTAFICFFPANKVRAWPLQFRVGNVVIIIICWRLIWPLVKSGAIAANPFAHIPPPPSPGLEFTCQTQVFGLIRLQLHHKAGVWTCESVELSPCLDVEPIYYCCKALLPPTHPPTVYQNLNPEFLISAGFLWLEIPNLLQRLMWLAHKNR